MPKTAVVVAVVVQADVLALVQPLHLLGFFLQIGRMGI
jgi:hypothetical protein